MEFSRAFHPGKRRATPIPVLPPRIPTPMPLNNNNNARSNKPKEQQQITISTISGGPSAMDMVGGKIQQQPHPHQMHYQNPQMSHHSGPDIPMLITKPSYKLLDNDVKTAWINPRLISKIDMGLIKKTEYASAPPERNMNGGGSCSGSGIPATTTIHHSQQQSRHPACGRLHEREWERGCVSINGRNTVSKSRSVPASIQAASDPRKKRSSGVRMDVHANTNINHQQQLQQQKSYIPKSTSRATRHQNQNQQQSQRQRNAQSAERLRTNILGYHHQSETSCYVGAGLTNSAGGVGGVYGIYSETNYIYSVNDSSQAAMFFAR